MNSKVVLRAGMTGTIFLLLLAVAFPVRINGAIETFSHTYREYAGEGKDPAWVDGKDTLTNLGYAMQAVTSGELNKPVKILSTPLGNASIEATPGLVTMDFHVAYGIGTFWPYCQSMERCLVYSQQDNTDPAQPVTLELPHGVQAFDFYVDIAIDCETVLELTAVCTAIAQPGGASITVKLASVCGSPFVGSYFGFATTDGSSINSLSVTCGSPFARMLGLLRVGAKEAVAAQS